MFLTEKKILSLKNKNINKYKLIKYLIKNNESKINYYSNIIK